jgi:hypothetical protein
MTRDLDVWTYEKSALVLIDCQKEMFEIIRSETSTVSEVAKQAAAKEHA